MKIISMHVLTKNGSEKSLFLKTSFELGFVPFMKRYFFKQHLSFGARTVATKSNSGDNLCVKLEEVDDARAYVVARTDLAAVMIADGEYPGKVAIKILHEVLDIFTNEVNPALYAGIKQDLEIKFDALDKLIVKYQNPAEADKIIKLENQLNDVQNMLTKTMGDLMERGEKLETLMERSEDINKVSPRFLQKIQKSQ